MVPALPRDSPPELSALVAAADQLLGTVASAKAEPVVRDEAQSFLVAAYGRTFRCMRAIRDLAAWPRCDADDAFILARSLVSTVAVSLWLAAPEQPSERAYRFERWRHSFAIERARTLAAWERVGLEFDPAALEQARSWMAKAKAAGIEELPSDGQMLRELDLELIYARVHRLGSDIAHFSLGSAANSFQRPITPHVLEGRTVALDDPQPDDAQEALAVAMLTYGPFLARCQPLIGHGAAPLALRLMQEWQSEHGDVTASD